MKVKISSKTKGIFVSKNYLLTKILIVTLAVAIFYLRDRQSLGIPNFYAEDGTVIYNAIYNSNPLKVLATGFNGYLIVGQYLLGYISVGLNYIFGGDLVNLPLITGWVSILFLGVTASLPFILFRRNLGTILSLILVILTALVPMFSSDYAIIGTLGNLKFAFLYIAFMLVVYRQINARTLSRKGLLTVDSLLLLCVFTNVTVAFLIPFTALPYVNEYIKAIRKKKLDISYQAITSFALSCVAFTYIGIALLKGIPEIPGYLDGPFNKAAIFPIIDRSVFYAFTYMFSSVYNSYFVSLLTLFSVIFLVSCYIRQKNDRIFIITAVFFVMLGTGLFILNRPGVGDYYLTYMHKGGPDQFFYAKDMIIIFSVGWILRARINKIINRNTLVVGAVLTLYLLLAIPYGSSYGGSTVVFRGLKPIKYNIDKACREYATKDKVIIQIYPSVYWQWTVDKDLACKY